MVIRAGFARVRGRVIAVAGDRAIVRPDRKPFFPADISDVRLEFEHAGFPVQLSGRLAPSPLDGTLAFELAHGGGLEQRRAGPRLTVALDTRVQPLAPDGTPRGEAFAARTVDFGEGGLQLARWRPPIGTTVRVTLALPGGDSATLDATVVRHTQAGCGLAFATGQEEMREALGALVLAVREWAAEQAA